MLLHSEALFETPKKDKKKKKKLKKKSTLLLPYPQAYHRWGQSAPTRSASTPRPLLNQTKDAAIEAPNIPSSSLSHSVQVGSQVGNHQVFTNTPLGKQLHEDGSLSFFSLLHRSICKKMCFIMCLHYFGNSYSRVFEK